MLNKTSIVWMIIGIFVVGVVLAGNLRTRQEPASVSQPNGQKVFAPQTDSQAEVTVEVAPKSLGVGKEVVFEVSLNTHSVALDQDFSKTSKLVDDLGNQYQVFSWSGGSGGHHLSGDLTFPKISGQAKSVELTISGIGGVERVFRWVL